MVLKKKISIISEGRCDASHLPGNMDRHGFDALQETSSLPSDNGLRKHLTPARPSTGSITRMFITRRTYGIRMRYSNFVF